MDPKKENQSSMPQSTKGKKEQESGTERKKTRELVKNLYKDEEGKPLVLTDRQCDLFNLVFKRRYPRNSIRAFTRYGKSLVVALGVLTRIVTFPEKWAIVAGTEKQAKIIMGYIIEHTFDNQICQKKLEIDKKESMDHLRRERSKSRLVYKHSDGTLGEVFILSGDSKNKASAGASLMGFGASNVVLDEASLVDDTVEAKVFRMLGDHMDNFYLKIGNPFHRNHFLDSCFDPSYHNVNIDWRMGIEEGRLNESFLEEARKRPQFSILYENQFPDEDAIDDEGYSCLITQKELDNALVELPKSAWFGSRGLGVDIARGGGNYNVWTMRCSNYATRIGKNQDPDLMSTVGTTIRLANEWSIPSENIFLDDTGLGGGVTNRLQEQRHAVAPVRLGEKADDATRFENRRAENFWRMKQWLNEGGKLDARQDWSELLKIKYKAKDSTGRLLIMPKDRMMKLGIPSPDEADSLALTFDRQFTNPVDELLARREIEEDFDPHSALR